jgi:hypothetical protein
MTIHRTLLKAVESQYVADRLKAQANLEVYLSNSVGVGGHSDIIAEIKELITQIHDADGAIRILDENYLEAE